VRDVVLHAVHSINKINNSVKTPSYIAVQQAMKYILQHFSERITLNQIAEHVHLNSSYFSIQFKKENGKNFIDYLKECRIEKAKELLKETNSPSSF